METNTISSTETNASDQVIEVGSASALKAAYATLSHGEGGTIKLTADAKDLAISLTGGGDAHVTITAADPENPVSISQIWLEEVENITIDGLHVESTGVPRRAWMNDLFVEDSKNVTISNTTFKSFAEGEYNPNADGPALAENLGDIKGSENVTFTNNDISGYYQGLGLARMDGITVSGNTFSKMQGDGIRMVAVRDVLIAENTFKDFYGTTNGFNHNDMIQMWSTNAGFTSENVTITGNVLNSGVGRGLQSIFIRNEKYESTGDAEDIYRNLTITDNLVYNGYYHGITVSRGADGVEVSNNTVLWNETGGGSLPTINVSSAVTNATLNGNIASAVNHGSQAQTSNNLEVDYSNPRAENYVGKHIVNPFSGGDISLDDLRLRADSPWADIDAGAKRSAALTESPDGTFMGIFVTKIDTEDPNQITLDARLSVGADDIFTNPDYRFEWQLSDGTVLTGPLVTHRFEEFGTKTISLVVYHKDKIISETDRTVPIEDATVFHLDFSQGFKDMSSHNASLDLKNADWVTNDAGQNAVEIGGSRDFVVNGGNTQLHHLQSFSLELTLETLDTAGGDFLRFWYLMRGSVSSSGEVSFRLVTDEGHYTVKSGSTRLEVGESETIRLSYSERDGTLTMEIGGEVVDEISVEGALRDVVNQALWFGTPWGTSVNARISEAWMSVNPEALIEPTPKAPDAPVMDLLNVDLTQGFRDLSDHGAVLDLDTATLETSAEGPAVRIGGNAYFEVHDQDKVYQNLDSFGLSLDLTRLDDVGGDFLRFSYHLKGTVHSDGTVSVRLVNDAGRFTVGSSGMTLEEGKAYTIAVGYWKETSELVLSINGEIVGVKEVQGSVENDWSSTLTIGTPWHHSLNALVTGVKMTSTPEDLGLFYGATTLEEPEAAAETEAEAGTASVATMALEDNSADAFVFAQDLSPDSPVEDQGETPTQPVETTAAQDPTPAESSGIEGSGTEEDGPTVPIGLSDLDL